MRAIIFEADRTGYTVDQVKDTCMTVGELMGELECMDEDDIVVISHDNGYTYGGLRWTAEEELEDEE